jgi:hypothetical protein
MVSLDASTKHFLLAMVFAFSNKKLYFFLIFSRTDHMLFNFFLNKIYYVNFFSNFISQSRTSNTIYNNKKQLNVTFVNQNTSYNNKKQSNTTFENQNTSYNNKKQTTSS